jgi:hypothetical protein
LIHCYGFSTCQPQVGIPRQLLGQDQMSTYINKSM